MQMMKWISAITLLCLLSSTFNPVPIEAQVAEGAGIYLAIQFTRCMICSNSGKAITDAVLRPLLELFGAGKKFESNSNFADAVGRILLQDNPDPTIDLKGITDDAMKCIAPALELNRLFSKCEKDRLLQVMTEVKKIAGDIFPGSNIDTLIDTIQNGTADLLSAKTLGLIGLTEDKEGDVNLKLAGLENLPIVGQGGTLGLLDGTKNGELPLLNTHLFSGKGDTGILPGFF